MQGGPRQPEANATPPPEIQHRGATFRVKRIIASAGGLGFFPLMPGTITSVVAAGVYAAIACFAPEWWIIASLALVVGVVGVWLGNQAEQLFGRKDPPAFVIDEVLGMWIALLGMGGSLPLTWYGVLAALILFRFFDIVKPYPASRLDKIHNGWGIMGDDVIAGLYAGIIVRAGWIAFVLLV